MDLLYNLLKVTSMVATGIFGALALLTRYKDEKGNITKWGKIALGGILVSSGISLGLYSLETYRAKAAAIRSQAQALATTQKLETILVNAETTAEQQKTSLAETNKLKLGLEKTLERSDYIAKGMEDSLIAQRSVLSGNRLILGGVTDSVKKQGELLSLNTGTLKEVSRGLYPIKDVRIGYWIRVPMDHSGLASYVDRFNRELMPLLPLSFYKALPWITGGRGSSGGNTFEAFGFSAEAPLAPNRTREELAYTLLSYSQVEVQFFKTPIDPSHHPLISRNWQSNIRPDLKLSVSGDFSRKEHVVEYDLKSKKFRHQAFGLSSDPRYWESTGKIVGIPDLLGAQMFVLLKSNMISGNPAVDQNLFEIRKRLELDTLIISLSTGREFWFKLASLQQHGNKDSYPIYSFRFPNTMDGLLSLEQR